jgi:hypothetical protein
MNDMLVGAIAMGSVVAGLYFLRFWKCTSDRFFLYFALSFFLQAGNRILLGVSSLQDEDTPLYYLIRLLAYGLILYAVIRKNRQHARSSQ